MPSAGSALLPVLLGRQCDENNLVTNQAVLHEVGMIVMALRGICGTPLTDKHPVRWHTANLPLIIPTTIFLGC